MIPGRLCKFRLYPSKGYNPYDEIPAGFYYYNIHVFKCKESMYQYVNKYHSYQRDDYEALSIYSTKHKYSLGNVVFLQDKLDGVIVAHEATHIALDYLNATGRLKIESFQNGGELLAYLVGNLTQDLVINFNKHDLYYLDE